MKIIILLTCGIFSIIVYIRTKKEVEKAKRIKGNIEIPNYDYEYYSAVPTELDVLFAAALFHCKDYKKRDLIKDTFPAILFSLVRKGFLRIENDTISVTQSTKTILTDAELEAYNMSFI